MADRAMDPPTGGKKDLSTWLASRPPREDSAEPLKVKKAAGTVHLERSDETAAAAVGVMVLERIASHSGTRLSMRTLQSLREALTAPFSSADVMQIEVEAYDLMSWLAGLDGSVESAPPLAEEVDRDLVLYDPDSSALDLLRRAIAEEFDVEIQYYTQSRGELTRRRITPTDIQAEAYLHAYCHTRRAERVFRISRIAEIRPVDGKPVAGGGDGEGGEGGPPAQGKLNL